jgi:hypothetical protein
VGGGGGAGVAVAVEAGVEEVALVAVAVLAAEVGAGNPVCSRTGHAKGIDSDVFALSTTRPSSSEARAR